MDKFNQLLNDDKHGSQYIVKKFLILTIEENWDKPTILQYGEKLQETFSSMSIIEQIVKRLKTSENIEKEISDILNQIEHGQEKITNKIIQKLDENKPVLTFSNSDTVLNALKNFEGKIFSMKSNPGGEGREMSYQLKSELITDNQGIKLIKNKRIQALIIGADQYSENYIINKKGTGKLTEICLENDIDVFILTSSLKFVPKIQNEIQTHLLEKSKIRKNMKFINDN